MRFSKCGGRIGFLAALMALGRFGVAQNTPIAIVPTEGVQLTGALDVAQGKAIIGASGTVTAGEHPVMITLPHRGNLRLCSTTKVTLTADSSVPASASNTPVSQPISAAHNATPPAAEEEHAGLMMALDRGALEGNFTTGKNSDIVLTPDFRIVISGPGVAAVRVRLGAGGDTCVDNSGLYAPYVSVTSVFDGGVYRVQANQRVMFQHGSLNEVIDSEKESCGCPPEPMPSATGNEFPVAQSAGLAPLPTPPPNVGPPGTVNAQATAQLSYDSSKPDAIKAKIEPAESVAAPPAPVAPKAKPRTGFFTSIGHFFRTIFGG
ncbi:hypothetical protein [Acidicapsa ligni]|uniref:hypothetical protein n=1 Tax=Acidicapsa ligni TaxID=542300 RepID=UPI0021E00AEC|nr:hypothetical protein [Acidicapsa ligni]